jgi:hypothetical protein
VRENEAYDLARIINANYPDWESGVRNGPLGYTVRAVFKESGVHTLRSMSEWEEVKALIHSDEFADDEEDQQTQA